MEEEIKTSIIGGGGEENLNSSPIKKKSYSASFRDLVQYLLDRNWYADADEAIDIFKYGPLPNENGEIDLSYYAGDYITNLDFTTITELPEENKKYLDEVLTTDKYKVVNMYYMFYRCNSLTSLDVSNWNTNNVTDMSYMFNYCRDLTSLNVSNWDTSNVTNMYYMFGDCNLTTLDVSNWDTSNVTNMSHMFYNCYDLTSLDVSNWNTSNVTSMDSMFENCNSLTSLDVSNWDTSNVTDMYYMFFNCNKLTTVTGIIDMSKVSSYISMLQGTSKLQSINIKLPSTISQSSFLSRSQVTNTSAVHFV